MTRTTSTVLTVALTAVFVFALSLAALAAPYAPADAPPGTPYGPLRGVVEDAPQPAVVDPATAPQPAVVTPATVPATDDAGTVILVASIVTGLFLAAIGGYVAFTARRRRAAHA